MGLKRRLIAGTINRYPAEDGWENVHLDKSDRPLYEAGKPSEEWKPPEIVKDFADVLASNIPSESFDEIRCDHALEHLTPANAALALRGFHRVLKSGGGRRLVVSVPDLDQIAKCWVKGGKPKDDLLLMIYGDQSEMPDAELNQHRWGWTETTLKKALKAAGFDAAGAWKRDCQLSIVARKP